MKPLHFLGAGVAGKSYTVTRQRKLNIYIEHRPDGDEGVKIVAFGTPGMRAIFAISPAVITPIRGFFGTPNSLYAVAAGNFYQLNITTGAATFTDSIGTISGLVSMAASPTQLVLVDGILGYLYNGATLTVIPAAFPSGAKTVTFVAGFFVAELPDTNQFYVSNLFDGSTWSALAFASASQYPDTIKACDNLNGNLVLFCQLHMEFWQNVGASPEPFAPILSATNEWGLAAIFSRIRVNSTLIFLGQTRTGQVQVCQLEGYNVKVISTPDIDAIINSFAVTDDCVGLAYQVDTHGMAQLTFPTADRSFLYDTASFEWSETQTGHTTQYASRHLANLSTLCNGKMMLTDSMGGQIYEMDPLKYTDNGAVIERELITRAALDGHNEFTIDEVFLNMEVGVGLISGQGSDPQVMLQVSKNNGKTFETERWKRLGAMGQYLVRLLWMRWGSARVFHFKLRMTDAVKFVIAGGAITARSKPQ